MPIMNKNVARRRKEAAGKAREKRGALRKMMGETGQPRKQKVEKRSVADVAKGQAHYKVTGGGTSTAGSKAGSKAGSMGKASVKAAITGKGGRTVGDKANVTREQLKASGLTLTQYMNQWNKSGKRPTGSSMALDKRPAPSVKKVESKSRGPSTGGVGTVLREPEAKSSKYAPNKQGGYWHKKQAKKSDSAAAATGKGSKGQMGRVKKKAEPKAEPKPRRGPKTMGESQADHKKYYKKPGVVYKSK